MHIYQRLWYAFTHETIIASQLNPLQPAAEKYMPLPKDHHDELINLITVIWDLLTASQP